MYTGFSAAGPHDIKSFQSNQRMRGHHRTRPEFTKLRLRSPFRPAIITGNRTHEAWASVWRAEMDLDSAARLLASDEGSHESKDTLDEADHRVSKDSFPGTRPLPMRQGLSFISADVLHAATYPSDQREPRQGTSNNERQRDGNHLNSTRCAYSRTGWDKARETLS